MLGHFKLWSRQVEHIKSHTTAQLGILCLEPNQLLPKLFDQPFEKAYIVRDFNYLAGLEDYRNMPLWP
uniref:Uncharacterized protein n=1 Tax=Candidatus Kentrum eta TaxID=2126337 RepID=A0A450VKP1_9GAMM|nr:MAG: hypothetical protein BECKH772A_GA0070896_102343 [Candidatus Kentron sp. H]VFK01864.1 MAG: hypothetical protein BECKH772B_GA0070898_102503 [Candidatus Kentron sp. H]VFK05363.1 MAG: hypothetical protein BECKH772C_GA0070978_102633 [Candidatus Kentron sp. H]